MQRTARHTGSGNTSLLRHPIGNRQARRRVFSDHPIARDAGAVFEPLENRALLSAVWPSDAVLNMHGGDSPRPNLDYIARQAGEVQVHMSGSAVQNFLLPDAARIDIVNSAGGNANIAPSRQEPVGSDIQGQNRDHAMLDKWGNDTGRKVGDDTNHVTCGGTPYNSLFGGWATIGSMPARATIL